MGGWGEYALAWALFLAGHMLPARPALRGPLVRRLGDARFALAYSAVSVAMLAWLVAAAGRAPALHLWGWAAWQAWVPNLVMPVACLLLALGAGIPNPFSIGGARADRYDPARPGVLALTRHPVLWAVTLWAGAHVPPNGDLAHVLMFVGFVAFGLVGMRALDRRRRRACGAAR
ncbi:NnrU family protein [Neoroseomonas rubea]|uniref:NnrU family protein n=1 Tax=Neoroseomonas rubea TaxID=2748666 RepID=UPI0018E02E64|nr:NnrU family protein [Roseomonas rubea]